MQTTIFSLSRRNMSSPVQHAAGGQGHPAGKPGVTAIVVTKGSFSWCLLADHPRNPGVSVTNGAAEYAKAVCRAFTCNIDDITWFELDSTGSFDQLNLLGADIEFAALHEPGTQSRSLEGFLARARALFGAIPEEAEQATREIARQFQHPPP